MSTNVVSCFRVICTLGQPLLYNITVCWCMVFNATSKAEAKKKGIKL